ncbi:MAG: hypothetical protein EOP06_28990 [Proteobacteria bacterium]|nr:MAG: hypothetical protein EOP06_28990 [Pseudomonadota bacterium]
MDTKIMEANIVPEPEPDTFATTPSNPAVPADSAMATGTDDEPEMTIADKHAGDTVPDTDGDGELSTEEAATILGADEKE